MADPKSSDIVVTCPCCSARLTIDPRLQKVIEHEAPPKVSNAPALDRAAALLIPAAAELRTLIDRDTAAYDAVVAASRLPKSTDAEKAARKDAVQKAMREAIEAPLGVMRACRTALAQLPLVEAHGNPNAASDVQVGRALLSAGLAGARANVEINLPSISDTDYATRVREEI